MSGLFGSTPGGNQSLFGGAAPSSGASTGGLFSTPSTGATTGGLFSNLGGAKTTAPSGTPQPASSGPSAGGLFSGQGASTPQPASTGASTGGLFSGLGGGLGASSTAPASSSTPFPSLLTSTAQPQTTSKPPFPSMFQTTSTSQAPGQSATANPFPSTQQTSAPGQSSMFTSSTAPQQPEGPLSQSNTTGGRSSHFDHLLERGRKRNAGENGAAGLDNLPSLQLGLGDIARKVRNLGTGGPSADQAQDRAAHYLLSASGVKMGSTLRDLNQFSTSAGLSTTGPAINVLDTDVDSYITNMHSQTILGQVEESAKQTEREFDLMLEEQLQLGWDRQRQRIYEHFGLGRHAEESAARESTFGSTAGRGAFGRSRRQAKSSGPTASQMGKSFGASTGAPPVIGSVMSPYQKKSLNKSDAMEKAAMVGQLGSEDRFTRDKQERFMEKVKELNLSRQTEQPYPILHAFKGVETDSGTDNTNHFINAYSTLISITREQEVSQVPAPPDAPKERCFARDYQDQVPTSKQSLTMRKRILDGSLKHLEKQFLDEVELAIRKHAREAQVGGVPSVLNKVRGYVRVKVAFKELGADTDELQGIGAAEEYPWVIVFYLLRGGLLKEAAEYVQENRTFFQNNDRIFLSSVIQYADPVKSPDRRLPPDLQQKINHVYAQRARIAPTNDPYRVACYKVVGRCDMTRRNLEPLNQTMDDWVWLQFNLAREGNPAEENAGEVFGLQELRASISDIGQRHFMSGGSDVAGGYGVFFYLSILAGMFEQGVNYLYQHNYVSAVHFAIGLAYYGLLRISDWTIAGTEILTYTGRELPQLNFGRIVGFYTSDFRAARADAAVEYLVLLCLNADLPGEAGKQQAALCYEALRELVLETREFSTLLGDVKSTGQGTEGLIQQRLGLIGLKDNPGLINTIIHEAAKMADDNGRTNDAVLLCHLAGEFDSVVTILNRALSEALSVDIGQEPLRLEPLKPQIARAPGQQQMTGDGDSSVSMLGTDDPVELANKVLELYDRNALWWRKVSQTNRDTMSILTKLHHAKSVIERQLYMQALDHIAGLNILPLNANGDLTDIRKSASSFSTYPPEIARNIGNVLLWCIGCCSRHREILLKTEYVDPTRQALADTLLQKARDLMVFAGLIRYKLPSRIFELLAREGGDAGVY
ncbi:NIC-domain-containing protein [Polyplosphaeria fusca]|uniref:NIC-domain-containing protein n=1 Tax=Polyplosphaeria fusca TaxID=682080 RepID=A0A9P4QX24_9PLEO|nr:NIC-domain-containing protein [Polyplosphaeria fusca]